MKSEFTIFEDAPGYWYVPRSLEKDAIRNPDAYRTEVHPTKISACRAALEKAVQLGATELHLHGFGSTTTIRREALAKGIKPFVYHVSITTRIAPLIRKKSRSSLLRLHKQRTAAI